MLNGHPSPTRSAVGGIGLIIAIILIVGIGWAWGYGGHGWGTWWNRNKSNHAANMAPHAGAPIAAVMPPRAPLASAQDQTQVPPQVPAQLQAQAPAQDQSLAPPQVQSQVPAATQSVAQQSQDNAGPADANCPGHPGALGTSRLLSLDPAQHPRVGHMQYPDSLPLNDKEVVLTFDDGPSPRYSNEILDILASQCVKATYFMVGEMARAYPAIVRRAYEEGHTIGTHSEDHPMRFGQLPVEKIRHEIDWGISDVGAALGGVRYLTPDGPLSRARACTRARNR